MWSVEHSVDTPAPAEAIWRRYVDVGTWPEWNSAVQAVDLDGAFKTGTTGTLTPPGQGGPLPFRLVSVTEQQGYVSETDIADTVTLRTSSRLSPHDGGTRITHRAELVGPAAAYFAQSFGPVLAAGVPRTVQALAAAVAGGPRRAVLVLTSHDTLGNTGRSTGAYASEVAEAWKVFRDAGYDVDLVSVKGGVPPLEAVNEQDPVQREFFRDATMSTQLMATGRPADVDAADCDILFLAGGHGAVWDLPYDKDLSALIRDVFDSGRVVASVCHGPAALIDVVLADGRHLVRSRRVTAFSNAEEKAVGMTDVVPFSLADTLIERGARYESAGSFLPHVVADGALVTGQNPASATGVAKAAVEVASGRPADRRG